MSWGGALTFVHVLVEVLNSASVEGRGSSDDTVNLVALGEQEFGEVGAVLASDTCKSTQKSRTRHKYQRWSNIGLSLMQTDQ